MRPYGRIYREAWKDRRVRALSDSAFRCWVYLVTGGHWSCILEKSPKQIGNGCGRDRMWAEAALDELVASGMVQWDRDADVIWVIKGLRYQIDKWNSNLAKGLERHLEMLPFSAVTEDFRSAYPDGPFSFNLNPNGNQPRVHEEAASGLAAIGSTTDCRDGPGPSEKLVVDQNLDQSPTTGNREQVTENRAQGLNARACEGTSVLTPAGAWSALKARLLELGHPTDPRRPVSWPGGKGPREWTQIHDQWGGLRGVLDWVERWHAHLAAGRGDASWWGPRALTQAAFERLVSDVEAWDAPPPGVPTGPPKTAEELYG